MICSDIGKLYFNRMFRQTQSVRATGSKACSRRGLSDKAAAFRRVLTLVARLQYPAI